MLNRIKVEYLESDRFIPIYLPEEQPGLYRLFDVWLAIIDEMKAIGYDIHRPEIDTAQEDFSYLSKNRDIRSSASFSKRKTNKSSF